MEAFFHVFGHKDSKSKKQAWKDFKDKKIDPIKLLRAFKLADLSFDDCKEIQDILEGLEQDKVNLAGVATSHLYSWIFNNIQLRIAASKYPEILTEAVAAPAKVIAKKPKAPEEKKEPKERPKTAMNGGTRDKKLVEKKEEEEKKEPKKPAKRPVNVPKPTKKVPKEQNKESTEENKDKAAEPKPKVSKVHKEPKPAKEVKPAKSEKEQAKHEDVKVAKKPAKVVKEEKKEVKPAPVKKLEEAKVKKTRPQTAKVEVKPKIKTDNKAKPAKPEEKKIVKPKGNKKIENKNDTVKIEYVIRILKIKDGCFLLWLHFAFIKWLGTCIINIYFYYFLQQWSCL